MAHIVGVHGTWQQHQSRADLQATWQDSLLEGLTRIQSPLLPTFALAFYGDLFRYPAIRPPGWAGSPASPSSDPAAPFPSAPNGRTLGHLRHIHDELQGVPEGDRDLVTLQAALAYMCESTWLAKAFRAVAFRQDWLRRSLDHVDRYFHPHPQDQANDATRGGSIREIARQRVIDAIQPGETRIVIGHSLGAVVAYEALAARPDLAAHIHLITVGAPLGIPNHVLDKLQPAPRPGRPRIGVWPGVASWTNLADPYDFVALVKSLNPIFGNEQHTVQDWLVDNWLDEHGIGAYLTEEKTAETLNRILGPHS